MSGRAKKVIQRLKEPSTWASLAPLLLLAGMSLPEVQAVTNAGAGIAALLGMVLGEQGGASKAAPEA